MTGNEEAFVDHEQQGQMMAMLEGWTNDARNVKGLFLELKAKILQKENVMLIFQSRSGVSHSLRATVNHQGEKCRSLFVLVDIIDDDPDNRWLSVCFYEDMITDPQEQGEPIPAGILGEDGYCFNLYEYDLNFVSYIKKRIEEAHKSAAIAK